MSSQGGNKRKYHRIRGKAGHHFPKDFFGNGEFSKIPVAVLPKFKRRRREVNSVDAVKDLNPQKILPHHRHGQLEPLKKTRSQSTHHLGTGHHTTNSQASPHPTLLESNEFGSSARGGPKDFKIRPLSLISSMKHIDIPHDPIVQFYNGKAFR